MADISAGAAIFLSSVNDSGNRCPHLRFDEEHE